MDKELFKELWNKYGFKISIENISRETIFSIQDVFDIFEKYRDNVKEFTCVEVHKMSLEEYDELISLEESELDNGYRQKCSGITKNGKRCGNVTPNSVFASSSRELYTILKDKWYCQCHEYQKEDIVRLSLNAIWG